MPRAALRERLAEGPDVYGIVHWGLNTYTDREWGYGDEDPKLLDPKAFDADQIVAACRDGDLGDDSRATIASVGGYSGGEYGNPDYAYQRNGGQPSGAFFRPCEADFPLRRGWFHHARERGTTKSPEYLLKVYLRTVGNGGTMNVGVAPNRDGRLDDEDVRALRGFAELKAALFANEVTEPGRPFNVVVLEEDLAGGEQVDHWTLLGDAGEGSRGARRVSGLGEPARTRGHRVVDRLRVRTRRASGAAARPPGRRLDLQRLPGRRARASQGTDERLLLDLELLRDESRLPEAARVLPGRGAV